MRLVALLMSYPILKFPSSSSSVSGFGVSPGAEKYCVWPIRCNISPSNILVSFLFINYTLDSY